MRREDLWIETVKKHWDPAFNPFRQTWDTDPFTNRIHSILYGRPDFNEQAMRERYRRHNIEVCDYFWNRPRDLLVMDMDFGWPKDDPHGYSNWFDLCSFLDQKIPGVPYPKAFAAY
jgi:hypothetical protein